MCVRRRTLTELDLEKRPRRVARWLSGPGCIAVAVGLGVFLTLPSLFAGFLGDDHFHYFMVTSHTRAPWDLFLFLDGVPLHRLMEIRAGDSTWIQDPETRIAFFRPFPSLTHWLDYRFLPGQSVIMHGENVAWYALLVGLVGALYRSLDGSSFIAGLAAIAYAMDDSHGATVGWIANRNAVMGGVAIVVLLLLHHAWRRRNIPTRAVPLLAFVAALACGEGSMAGLGFLLAYAAFLDAGPAKSRIGSVLPYVVAAAVWLLWVRTQGYGVAHTMLYQDLVVPEVMLKVPFRVMILSLISLKWPGADLLALVPFGLFWAAALVHLGVSVVLVVTAATRDKKVAFWATGAFLALLPACSALPNPRLLLIPSIGSSMAVIRTVAHVSGSLPGRRARSALWFVGMPSFLVWMAVLFLGGPILLLVRSAFPQPQLFPASPPARPLIARPDQNAIVVNYPDWHALAVASHAPSPPETRPLTVTQLVSASAQVHLERPDERTLIIRSSGGLLGATSAFLRPGPIPMGTRVQTPRCVVEVLEATPSGEPGRLRVVFDTPLEDASLAWFTAAPDGFAPLVPPAVGRHVTLLGFVPPATREPARQHL